MENNVKYLLKNTSILAISSFSSKFLMFLLVPLYTSILTTNEYGTFDLISTTIQLIMPVITANIYEGVTRYLMDHNKSKVEVASIGTKFLCIGIFLFGLLMFINWKMCFWESVAHNSVLIFLFFTSTLLNNYMTQFAKGLEAVRNMGIAGIIGTFVTLICNILFLAIIRMGLSGILLAYVVGQSVTIVYYFITLRMHQYFKFRINARLQMEMLKYSFPLIINTLGWWANNVSDRYIVTFICGIATNGIYSVSYKIPSILNTIQGIFTQSWQISAIKEYGTKKSKEFFGQTFYVVNIMVCFSCMCLILGSKFLARILFAKDFFEAWKYVPFLLVSITVNAASGILGPILCAKKDSKSMAMSAGIGAFANIVLNILLINVIGAQGAAIATAISSLIIYLCRRRAVGNDIIIKNKLKFAFSWMAIITQSLIMIYLENYILQIILMVVFCIVFRKTFAKYIKIIYFSIKK